MALISFIPTLIKVDFKKSFLLQQINKIQKKNIIIVNKEDEGR